jgi:hypothetical protein
MNAAHANAQEGSPENMIVAEGLERLVRRTLRRIKSSRQGYIAGSRLSRATGQGVMGTLDKSGVPTYLVQGYESIGMGIPMRFAWSLNAHLTHKPMLSRPCDVKLNHETQREG